MARADCEHTGGTMTTWVLYHANCYDGFGAAWAAWKALGVAAEYRAVNYGEEPVAVNDGEQIYLLDFSYPQDTLLSYAMRNPVVVLDHHESTAKDLEGLVTRADVSNLKILFDVTKSGAVLAWEHFHPGKPVPLMLQYVQDRDLWRFTLPGSRKVAAWMRSWPFDFRA